MCSRLVLAAASLAAAGCALSGPTPMARVRKGPAIETPPRTILALPATCEPAGEPCTEALERAVEAATRMSLEFAGYRLLDSERINVHARVRTERISGRGRPIVEISGAGWNQASPAQRADLLAEMGVEGMLAAHIAMGPIENAEGLRTVTVTVRVSRARDGALVWRSRCAAVTGRFHGLDQAVELATRCAVEGAALMGAT